MSEAFCLTVTPESPRPERDIEPPCIFRGGARKGGKPCKPCQEKTGLAIKIKVFGCGRFGNCTLEPLPVNTPAPAYVLPVCQGCKARVGVSPVLDSPASALVG